jgi:hypothetical protein
MAKEETSPEQNNEKEESVFSFMSRKINPKLKGIDMNESAELKRYRRNAKLVLYVGIGALALFAYRAHKENLMWREEITEILRVTTTAMAAHPLQSSL